MKRSVCFLLSIFCVFLLSAQTDAVNVPLSLFSMKNYSQDINKWIPSSSSNYNKPLVSSTFQQQRLQEYYNHLYGDSSPWNKTYVNELFQQQPDLKTLESEIIDMFDNGKTPANINYGENFHPLSEAWIEKIRKNVNLGQFSSLTYDSHNRAIAITNLQARVLPTNDPAYYDFIQPGQGFPFDNLQVSSLWAGTPVYIVAQTQDKVWDYVIAPSYFGWVKSTGIARATKSFVELWTSSIKTGSTLKLAAITKTQTSVFDTQGHFRFSAYVGAVFPMISDGANGKIVMLIPKMAKDGFALIDRATIASSAASPMPLAATPHHFADIIATLLNRPYGWGGMFFDNDCSQALKSLFAPFAIWLPRHSSTQLTAGEMVDLSSRSMNQRLNYLLKNGHPLMTIIYIGGHIILYVGKEPSRPKLAMSYQNLWGLSPANGSSRSVIGESVFLPLLKNYGENDEGQTLVSEASKPIFQISYLDQFPDTSQANQPIDLKSLVYP